MIKSMSNEQVARNAGIATVVPLQFQSGRCFKFAYGNSQPWQQKNKNFSCHKKPNEGRGRKWM